MRITYLVVLFASLFNFSCDQPSSHQSESSGKSSLFNDDEKQFLSDSSITSNFGSQYKSIHHDIVHHTNHPKKLTMVDSWTLFNLDSTAVPSHINLYFQHFASRDAARKNFNIDKDLTHHYSNHTYECYIDSIIVIADFPGATPSSLRDSLWTVLISDSISSNHFFSKHPK